MNFFRTKTSPRSGMSQHGDGLIIAVFSPTQHPCLVTTKKEGS